MDRISKASRSKLMKKVRSKHTAPEVAVRRLLHRLGYRFRLHRKDLPGTPDVVLPKYRTAVFVQGCLWHGHDCPRGARPTSNAEFWAKKIDGNIRRDADTQKRLRELGWRVLVVWQCRMKDPQQLEQLLSSIGQTET